jgi:hypothetical protein
MRYWTLFSPPLFSPIRLVVSTSTKQNFAAPNGVESCKCPVVRFLRDPRRARLNDDA